MHARDIPNLISGLRIVLVVPLAWLLLERRYDAALVIFAIAGVSDGVDGFLAKHFDWRSRLGGLLDPVADKLLLVTSFVCLGWVGALPLWLVLLVILRDVVIVTGAVCYHWLIEAFDAAPTPLSKLNTVTQILLVLIIIVDQGLLVLPPALVSSMLTATAATTLLSGASYVWTWGQRAVTRRGRPG
jgi:cardiolipin synthase